MIRTLFEAQTLREGGSYNLEVDVDGAGKDHDTNDKTLKLEIGGAIAEEIG